MLNKKKLCAMMIVRGKTADDLAAACEISLHTFYQKRNGKTEFLLREVNAIRKALSLTDDETLAIFFAA